MWPMLSKERAYAIIDLVLEEAKGYETAVIVQGGNEALTRFANSEIHQNVQASSMDVTIAVTRGHKRSAVTTGLCTPEGLRRATGGSPSQPGIFAGRRKAAAPGWHAARD